MVGFSRKNTVFFYGDWIKILRNNISYCVGRLSSRKENVLGKKKRQ